MNKAWEDMAGKDTAQALNAVVSADWADRWLGSNRRFCTSLVFCRSKGAGSISTYDVIAVVSRVP